MMIYIKNQLGYLLFLFLIFVLPLILFYQFSTYPLPYIQYFMLGVLFLFQYAFFKEKEFRRSIEQKVTNQLQRELKRTPARKEINQRLNIVSRLRGVTIVLTAIEIIVVMFYYQKF